MTILENFKRRKIRESLEGMDKWLNISVAAMLVIGTVLVYAATRSWFASQGLDPHRFSPYLSCRKLLRMSWVLSHHLLEIRQQS